MEKGKTEAQDFASELHAPESGGQFFQRICLGVLKWT